jgi:hypothetical protein
MDKGFLRRRGKYNEIYGSREQSIADFAKKSLNNHHLP